VKDWKGDGGAGQTLKTRQGKAYCDETSPNEEKLPVDEADLGKAGQGGGGPLQAEADAGEPKDIEGTM